MVSQIYVPLTTITFDVNPNDDCRVFIYDGDPVEVTEKAVIDTPIVYVYRKKPVVRFANRTKYGKPSLQCYCSAWSSGHTMDRIDMEMRKFMTMNRSRSNVDLRIVLRGDRYVIDPYETLIKTNGLVIVA